MPIASSARVATAVVWALVVRLEPAARAEADGRPPPSSLTFSNLVVRVDGAASLGFAGPDFRVTILEQLRDRGYNAVGAESLVFNIDEAQ